MTDDPNVYGKILGDQPFTLLKNQDLLKDFLKRFEESAEIDGQSPFSLFRRNLYHYLADHKNVITNAQKSVIIAQSSVHSLEAFCRSSFEFAVAANNMSIPDIDQYELSAILQGELSDSFYALARLYKIPDDDNYYKRIKGKLTLAGIAAKFTTTFATSMTNAITSENAYDAVIEAGFIVAEQVIAEGIKKYKAKIYADDFAKYLLSEAPKLAKSVPGKYLMTPRPQVERIRLILEGLGEDYPQRLLDKIEEKKNAAEQKLREEQEQGTPATLEIVDLETKQQVNIQDAKGVDDAAAQTEALQAGKTIIDYLKNIKITTVAQEEAVAVDAENNTSGDTDDTENELEITDSDFFYDVMIANQRRQLKKEELIAIIMHGQHVSFNSDSQMRNFNDNTQNKYVDKISLTPASQGNTMKLDLQQQQQTGQQQNIQQNQQQQTQTQNPARQQQSQDTSAQKQSPQQQQPQQAAQQTNREAERAARSSSRRRQNPRPEIRRSENRQPNVNQRRERREERKVERSERRQEHNKNWDLQVEGLEREMKEREQQAKERAEKRQQNRETRQNRQAGQTGQQPQSQQQNQPSTKDGQEAKPQPQQRPARSGERPNQQRGQSQPKPAAPIRSSSGQQAQPQQPMMRSQVVSPMRDLQATAGTIKLNPVEVKADQIGKPNISKQDVKDLQAQQQKPDPIQR